MMRAFALVLLVTNLLLFAWGWTRTPEAPPAAATALQASPLVLLAEMPTRHPAPAAADPAPAAPGIVAPAAGCQALGPFGDRDAVIAARDRLLVAGVSSLPSAVDASERLGFWVHTRPAATRDEATLTIDRLRRAGIRDFYVVTDGDVRNAVSLGVFGQPATAEQHATRLRAMGFDVVVGERRRQMTAWWLEFTAPDAETPEADAIAALIRAGETLTLEPRTCE